MVGLRILMGVGANLISARAMILNPKKLGLVWVVTLLTAVPVWGVSFRPVSVPVSNISPQDTVHPIDLWGDSKHELVVARAKGELEIYGWEGNSLALQQTLRIPLQKENVTYFSFAHLSRHEKAFPVVLLSDGLYFYPRQGERFADTPQRLLERTPLSVQGEGPPLQYFDLSYDLDRDGVDEILLPEQEGFSIFHAEEEFSFRRISIPRNPFKRTKSFQFRQQLPDDPVRVSVISGSIMYRRGVDDLVFLDANGDGLEDIVYTSILPGRKSQDVERYEIFFQKKGLTFNTTPDQVVEIPYNERAYVTFRDFNKDGRAEAFVVTSNYDIVAPRTVVRILGGSTSRTTDSKERLKFTTKDPIGLVKLGDFNADGLEDFACTFFSYQFASAEDIASLVAANRVKFRLQFYLGNKQKLFGKQPDYEYELNLSLKPESYGAYLPFYLVDDMNGDKIADLIARADETRVAIYLSQGKLSYPRQPSFAFNVPTDAMLAFDDLNGDGKTDILITSILKPGITVYLAP
jgi:hypothetical protein